MCDYKANFIYRAYCCCLKKLTQKLTKNGNESHLLNYSLAHIFPSNKRETYLVHTKPKTLIQKRAKSQIELPTFFLPLHA